MAVQHPLDLLSKDLRALLLQYEKGYQVFLEFYAVYKIGLKR